MLFCTGQQLLYKLLSGQMQFTLHVVQISDGTRHGLSREDVIRGSHSRVQPPLFPFDHSRSRESPKVRQEKYVPIRCTQDSEIGQHDIPMRTHPRAGRAIHGANKPRRVRWGTADAPPASAMRRLAANGGAAALRACGFPR